MALISYDPAEIWMILDPVEQEMWRQHARESMQATERSYLLINT